MTFRRRTLLAAAALLAGATAILLVARRGPSGSVRERAAPQVAAMAFEASLEVVRPGTPAGEIAAVNGLTRLPFDPAREPAAEVRRRSELRVRWAAPEPRVALLDLEAPPVPAYAVLRVLLNGFRVARLDVAPGRKRYAVDLPAERQLAGVNALTLVFGQPAQEDEPDSEAGDAAAAAAGRLFGVAFGRPGPLVDALHRARLPFTAWADGQDVIQAGPSTLAWPVLTPPGAGLRFTPAAIGADQGPGELRVEVESAAGERRVLWSGAPSDRAVTVALPGPPGAAARITFSVSGRDDGPAWAVWKDVALLGDADRPREDRRLAARLEELRRKLAGLHVVVVSLDAAGASHFGAYGYGRRTTPAMDRIAAEGVLFERHYATIPLTRGSVATLWTSQLPDEHHAGVSYEDPLPHHVPTLAEHLDRAGVHPAAFAANPNAGGTQGLDRGFREFFPVSLYAAAFRQDLHAWLARRAQARERFFLYVHYREPHYPFDPPPPFDTAFGPDAPLPPQVKNDRTWMHQVNEGTVHPGPEELAHFVRLYDGNLAAVDAEIGRLRERLEALGLWDRTVLVVTSDHGEAMYQHGFIGHNEQLYEPSVRIPLLVRFPPGLVTPGQRVRALTDSRDVAPTVAEIMGLAGERWPQTFRGTSLLPHVLGAPLERAELLLRAAGPRPRYALLGMRDKYHFSTRDGQQELYDLQEDPGETRDLSAAQPVRAAYARHRLFLRLLELPVRSAAAPRALALTPEQEEQLRALGYIQ